MVRSLNLQDCATDADTYIHDPYGLRYVLKDIRISAHLSVFRIAPGSTPALWVGSAKLYSVSVSCVRVKSIRNTDTEYEIRFVPQSLNAEYGYGIRDTVRAPKPQY